MLTIPKKSSRFFNIVPRSDKIIAWGRVPTLGPKFGMSGAGVIRKVEEPLPEIMPDFRYVDQTIGEGLNLAGGEKEPLENPGRKLKEDILGELAQSGNGMLPLSKRRIISILANKFMPMMIGRFGKAGFRPTSQYGGRMKTAFRKSLGRIFTPNGISSGGAIGAILATAASVLPELLPVIKDAGVAIWNFFKKIFRKKKGRGLKLAGQGSPVARHGTKIIRLFSENVGKFIKAMIKKPIENMTGRGIGSFFKNAFKKVVTFFKKVFKKGKKIIKKGKDIVKKVAPHVQKIAKVAEPLIEQGIELLPEKARKKARDIQTKVKGVQEKAKKAIETGRRLKKRAKTIMKKLEPATKQLMSLADNI